MAHDTLATEMPVFAHDGEISFGAVREIYPHEVVIFIENMGDVRISRDAIADVHYGKVLLDVEKLPDNVRAAIQRAHSAEDGQ